MRHIYTSVDIGSDTIKIVVCELFNKKLNLLAASSIKSKGIKKGLITDVYEASESVKQGIREIEEMLGIQIKKVITSVPSYYADYVMIKGQADLNLGEGESITGQDVSDLLNLAIKSKNIGDINSIREKYAKEQVGAIINIGSETTTVSLYNKGIIVKSSIIGLGGKNIDNDIAYIYKLKPENATKVKERFALAHKRYASTNDIYETEDKTGETVKINQFEVSEIVMSRIEEILVLARKEINILTKREVDYILITGGTSGMSNFSLISEEVLGKVTKIGNIKTIGLRNNKYSSAIGNIIYFINKLKLKGKNYTMLDNSDVEELTSTKKSLINVSNESMLGKVFGYFFSE